MASRPDIQRNIRKGLAVAVVASALFSAKSVFHKLCFRYGTPPVVLQTLRALFSLPFFVWPFVAHLAGKRTRHAQTFAAKDVLILAVLGLTGFYVASLLDMLGLQYVSAGKGRVVPLGYSPPRVLFFGVPFPRPPPSAAL